MIILSACQRHRRAKAASAAPGSSRTDSTHAARSSPHTRHCPRARQRPPLSSHTDMQTMACTFKRFVHAVFLCDDHHRLTVSSPRNSCRWFRRIKSQSTQWITRAMATQKVQIALILVLYYFGRINQDVIVAPVLFQCTTVDDRWKE